MSGFFRIYYYVFIAAFALFGCNSPKSAKTKTNENANKGEALFHSVGCTQCHSLEGQAMYGPALNDILNTDIQVIREGKDHVLTIDREYIHRSIQNPDFEKPVNFKNSKMPKTELSPEEIEFITDYLLSINEN
ncbi:MAG: hypothetical protein A2066_15910 [Bacteroidetes bacterium GWB2_41_8]|nr:MAG: hypothetical protein A2066_15910 [Bacteroidetes bacterium GWB2_41_8]